MTGCRRFTVEGRVQGVGFRAATRRRASRLGLCGWVRNRPDGCVDGLACGDDDALQAFADWLAQGPPTARVSRLDYQRTDCPDPPPRTFAVR